MRKQSGFTLIELVTVIAIVGILAAIAIPAFTDQVRKSRRSEAMTTLQDQQLRLERHRVDNASYATYTLPATLPSTYYTFGLTDAGSSAYTLTATPKDDQAKDKCQTLKITNTAGVVAKTVTGSGSCW